MAPIERFEDIEGWQKSRVLQEAFSDAAQAASFRDLKLKDQMERCTESAMSNIAEGFDAGSNPEFVRFLKISYRSLSEFQSHLYTCKYKRQLPLKQCEKLYDLAFEAKSKVGGFIRYLKAHPKGPKKSLADGNPKPTRKVRPKPKFDSPAFQERPNSERTLNPEP